MGDPVARKSAVMNRLRKNLKKRRESLADEFDFRMYVVIEFKDKKKKTVVFEVDEVMSEMTSNHQLKVLHGSRADYFSCASYKELMNKDIVQFHAYRWRPMRRDVEGSKSGVDFFLWPRNDIACFSAHVFSKWKGADEPYRPLDLAFTLTSEEYERYLMYQSRCNEDTNSKLIATNTDETFFLFVNKHQMKTAKNTMMTFVLNGVCVYIPQDQLMNWKQGTTEDLLAQYLIGS